MTSHCSVSTCSDPVRFVAQRVNLDGSLTILSCLRHIGTSLERLHEALPSLEHMRVRVVEDDTTWQPLGVVVPMSRDAGRVR